MLLDNGQSLDVDQQAKPWFLGISWRVALPPFHELFSPWTLVYITCLSSTLGPPTHRVEPGQLSIHPKVAGDASRLQA